MVSATRIVGTVALALWVGGIFFFAIGVAPVAFRVLPTSQEAGLVVASSLRTLHRLGLSCGFLYVATVLWNWAATLTARTSFHPIPQASPNAPVRGRSKTPLLPASLALVMLLLTSVSHFIVLPRMVRDRSDAGGDISRLAPNSAVRDDFDRLHRQSEQIEGTVLLLGLAALTLTTLSACNSSVTPGETR